MNKTGKYFFIDNGDEYWEIGRITGPMKNGKYPFEFLVSGFMPDENFFWQAKFDDGFIVGDDNFTDGRDDIHTMISIVFEDKAYWILDKFRNTKEN